MALTPAPFKRRAFLLTTVAVVVLGVALIALLAMALTAIGGWTQAGCDNPPALTGTIPQIAIVVVLTASFVVGGLTSTWHLRPTHGQQRRDVEHTLDRRRVRQTMRVAFAMVFLLLTALMILEGVTLQLQVWPITSYVRCASEANTQLAVLGGAIYTFLAGRWLWNWREEQ